MRYLLSLSFAFASTASYASDYRVKMDESVVIYRVHAAAGMDRVESTSHKVEGSAQVSPTGGVQVTIRVPVASFDSKNEKRDAKMQEVTEASRYPSVDVTATGDVVVPTSFPNAVTRKLNAQIAFHGITQPVDATVTMNFQSATRVTATVFLKLSLGAFHVERPKMMFFQVADELLVEGKVVFEP